MSASALVAAVLADSPRAFWQLQDASGNPVDSSGNSLDMTSVTGAPNYRQTGPLGDFAIRLQSTVKLNRTTQVSTVVDNFTMECWVKLVTSTDGRTLFGNGFSATTGWGIQIDSDSKFRSEINDGAGSGVKSVNALSTTAWSHVVVLRRATNWEYYFNGGR